MAPLKQTSRPPLVSASQLSSNLDVANSSLPSPRNVKLPPSPTNEPTNTMTPLSLSTSMESEGDIDSETELPTMTPPRISQLPLRPRKSSPPANPFSSRSSNTTVMAHQMQRAHSSPGVDSTGRFITPGHAYPRRPPSPLSSGRRRSPLRTAFEDAYPNLSWNSMGMEPNIPEHEELEISTPVTPEHEFGSISAIPSYPSISNTFPRSRRRPTSPLHQSASAPSLHTSARSVSSQSSNNTSPSFQMLSTTKYANEPYPMYGYSLSSASSMPSTPTSLRSRSPSISSLETIEDTPDAEEAAMLEDESSKQQSGDESDGRTDTKRRALDQRTMNLRSNKDRKRWSVCGAERRADFSLEPIEE